MRQMRNMFTKIRKGLGKIGTFCLLSSLFFSCITKPVMPPEAPEEETPETIVPKEDIVEKPVLLTELPVIEYAGAGIKYEFESMLLHNFVVFEDTTASGGFATKLEVESSTAQVKIRFPAGTYECLVAEKATDNAHSAFYVYLDDMPYRVYPSNPPLGFWELTTRVPIYFTIEETRSILITVKANSEKKLGNTGMSLDYIQFVKRD